MLMPTTLMHLVKNNGFIYVEIENTGVVTAEFSVSCYHHSSIYKGEEL